MGRKRPGEEKLHVFATVGTGRRLDCRGRSTVQKESSGGDRRGWGWILGGYGRKSAAYVIVLTGVSCQVQKMK